MNNKNVFAVIPARGGSKGIPQKNMYPVCGLPLICHTIRSAKNSKLITHLIVSTDDLKISAVAKEYGVDVPFIRPEHLATDQALAVDVMRHAIEVEEKRLHLRFDYIVMLQPTSPLKTGEDIDDAIAKLIQTNCDTVVTMVDVGANHPARMYRIKDDRLVSIMEEGIAMRPRQELPPIYIRNGAVYAFRRNVIDDYGALIGKDVRPLVMTPERSVNIDDYSDLLIAEYFISKEKCLSQT